MRIEDTLAPAQASARWLFLLPAIAAIIVLATPVFARSHGGYSDVVQFGSSVVIGEGEDVADVVVFGGDVAVHGHVHGDAVVFGGDLHVFPEGQVDGDGVVFGGSRINDSKTRKPHVVPTPMGTGEPTEAPNMSSSNNGGSYVANDFSAGLHWINFVIADAILAFLAFLLFPIRARITLDHMTAQPLVSVLLGFFAPILLALVMLVMVVTVIGIPLVPVVAVAFLLAYLIGKATIGAFVGRRLLEVAKVVEPNPLAAVALGLLIMVVVCGVTPHWFGVLIFIAIGALASGAALLGLMRVRAGLTGPPPPGGYMPVPVGGYPPSGYPPPPGPPAVQ
jgi:hypothetical protein